MSSDFLLFTRLRQTLVAQQSVLSEFSAFIAKIYPRLDLFEISDTTNSIRCTFSQEGLSNLQGLIQEIGDHEMNILALVGK